MDRSIHRPPYVRLPDRPIGCNLRGGAIVQIAQLKLFPRLPHGHGGGGGLPLGKSLLGPLRERILPQADGEGGAVTALEEEPGAPPLLPQLYLGAVEQIAEHQRHTAILLGFNGLAEHRAFPQVSRCDPVQNLLRLDLQVLFPGGEGLKPSLPTLRGVEGDFPVLLNPQGVRSLLDHRAVHRLIDRGGPGIEIQRLQQGLLSAVSQSSRGLAPV